MMMPSRGQRKTSQKTIRLVSLGCSKNLVDSEKILGQLPADSFRITSSEKDAADIVIINTCGFIQDAKQESIDTILSFAEEKKSGRISDLIVMGCLSERYRKELPAEIPEVDAWFGVDQPADLFERLHQTYDASAPQRKLTTPSHVAYLKVSEGCDRTCSFCAIPLIRGAYHSVPVDKLIEEATYLAGQGVKELLLVAQDLSYYGRDLGRKDLLKPLLEGLAGIHGIEWIRMHYLYPKSFPGDIIPLIAEHPKICRYIDMPFQHINDNLLKAMRRGHDKKETIALIDRLRDRIPGVALRTTMLVGFPGETDEAFDELLEFVSKTQFDRLGVFTYSPEEQTSAYRLGDPVSEHVKNERAAAIMDLQQNISFDKNQQRIGQTMRVVIDREEGDYYVGRTEFDSLEVDNEVFVDKADSIKPGGFYDVLITGTAEFELFGRLQQLAK